MIQKKASFLKASSKTKPTKRNLNLTKKLENLLGDTSFFVPAKEVIEIRKTLDVSVTELLRQLVDIAKTKARPPISNYSVGAAGLGKSGAIYLGVNLEFEKNQISQTVHAEQFVVANAFNHKETRLAMLAVSAQPCGHCRQWLNELNQPLKLLVNKRQTTLKLLLPNAFGPRNLGLKGGLFTPFHHALKLEKSTNLDVENPLFIHALEAAKRSYAPYSNSPSSIALMTKDGKIYTGSYLENAAFNPSLAPLQTALTALIANGKSYDDIAEACLVEKKTAKISQEAASYTLLKSIAPQAKFYTCFVE
jgi:cytidine deaminase